MIATVPPSLTVTAESLVRTGDRTLTIAVEAVLIKLFASVTSKVTVRAPVFGFWLILEEVMLPKAALVACYRGVSAQCQCARCLIKRAC